MSGIVLGGRLYPVPGVAVGPYRQVARVSPRRLPIRAVVIHTGSGEPVRLVDGGGPDAGAEDLAAYNVRTTRLASWDYSVDRDSIAVSNDPIVYATWHASQVNGSTLGIEMSVAGGALDRRTLANTLALVDVLTGALGIQRQIPWVGGRSYSGLIQRATAGGGSGTGLVGLYGHDNAAASGERGTEDSPDAIWDLLFASGYEGFDFNAGADLAAWRARQAELGVGADGIPGARTVAALAARGRPCGIWVPRAAGCVAATGTVPAQRPPGAPAAGTGAQDPAAGGEVPAVATGRSWAPWVAALVLGLGAAAVARRRA